MALKSYLVTKDFKTPYVVSTGRPDRPTEIKVKRFSKGEIINGELKHANNAPAFVLVKGTLVVPLEVVKEVVTKEILSHAEGNGDRVEEKTKAIVVPATKLKYIDSAIVGGVLGFGLMFLAEKKNWITPSGDNKKKIYATVLGALAGIYIAHRIKNKKK